MKNFLLACRVHLLSVLFLFLALTGSVNAGELKAPGPLDWEEVVKKAEQEGQVNVYASNSVGNLQIIFEAFQKRYPKIKLSGASGHGSDMVPRIMAERRASKYLADLFLGAPTTIYLTFYRAKILEPIPPRLILAEVTDLSKWWQGKHHYGDQEGQYIFVYESRLYGLPVSYNTKLVNQEEIKSAWDVVASKWKGRLEAAQIGRTEGSTALIFLYHHPQIGPKFIEKVYRHMDAVLFRDFRQATDWLAQGKFALCFLCRRIERASKQALPVAEINPYDLFERPGIGAGSGAMALMKLHPHPNAAKVFINWYLSREGQIAFRLANLEDERTTSLREDLPLDILPQLGRRRRDKEYLFVNRPDWMDSTYFKYIHSLMEEVAKKSK